MKRLAVAVPIIALAFLISIHVSSCANATFTSIPGGKGEPPKQPSDDLYAGRPIKDISTIVPGLAKTLDWSHTTNEIAFEKYGNDGYTDIYLLDPYSKEEINLTDGKSGCPQKSNGNCAWHPSGKYIVFTAEKEENPAYLRRQAIPGSGFNCDLYLMTDDGRQFYRLTNYTLNTRAVIHPHFSRDGNQLFWAERLGGSSGTDWGEWALKIADFSLEDGVPQLIEPRTYQPGEHPYFYESHSFSPDNSRVLFTANSDGQSDAGFDIYEMDLTTGKVQNLTLTPGDWDEHAHYSPDGKLIAWMTSTGLKVEINSVADNAWEKELSTELWLMNSDGSKKQRLTYFNASGYPESLNGKRAIVSDITWSPDGLSIAALVGLPDSPEKSKIFLFDLR